jgi:hypothetical protein
MSGEEWTSTTADIASLEVEARQAYEQNRSKEALVLVNKVLGLQPENETALLLHSAIACDIDRILNEVRATMEERQGGSAQGRLCAAEVMLLKALDIDPRHRGASALLQATRSLSKTKQVTHVERVERKEELPFTADHTPAPTEQKTGLRVPVLLLAVAILGVGGLLLTSHSSDGLPAGPAEYVKTVIAAGAPASAPTPVQDTAASAPVLEMPTIPEGWISKPKAAPTPAAPAAKAATSPASSASIVVKARPNAVPLMQSGTLAVSSPVATDIYEGPQYLGATPTTLALSPGTHTLEYRHANLRKTMTYDVKADEASSALITFDVVVQVNAKPWAQVFLDGSERQSLGQTPLSDVRVPIGRVLLFENPKYPTKSYRITGKESSIQMVFP